MKTDRLISILLTLALLAPLGASAERKCPKLKQGDFIYAIGSSTMGISLGPAIERAIEKMGFKFRKWAKASSGLARPDFHDWPAQVPQVVEQWSPDAFVISLGTNDYQAIFTDGGWIRPEEKKKWSAAYAERVDRMLELASGKDRSRVVIWVGPTPFDTRKGRTLSARISRIIKERIEAFDGPAFYVDMVAKLLDEKGRTVSTFKTSADASPKKVYGGDGVHLTLDTVRWLMAKPVADILTDCQG